jgi:hypothetical protein
LDESPRRDWDEEGRDERADYEKRRALQKAHEKERRARERPPPPPPPY